MNKTMIETEFWDGQLIELHTEDKTVYQSQIISKEQDLIYIQKPVNRHQAYLWPTNGMPVTVYFYDYNHGLCTFDTHVHTELHRLSIATPAKNTIRKAQRRRFLRVSANIDIKLSIPAVDDSSGPATISCTTYDISGGGLAFHCEFEIKPGQTLDGTIELQSGKSQKEVPFVGKVVHCVRLKKDSYKISLEYHDMKEAVRSEIVRYCLQKQLELRDKLKE